MAKKNEGEAWDLRIPNVPKVIHQKVERWMELHNVKTGAGLNKGESAVELLAKATKKVKLPIR